MIDECGCGSPDTAHRCLRRVLGDIEMVVSEIRDAATAPTAGSALPGLVGYVLIGAAWGWGVAEASGGFKEPGILHGALWPLSAAFLIARWLAGGH